MNYSSTLLPAYAPKLNEFDQVLEVNRITLNKPSTVYDVLMILEGEMEYFGLAKTALLRTVVPEWGGPEASSGKHVSPLALAFIRSVPTAHLAHALQLQHRYFQRAKTDATAQSRHRHYLKKLIDEVRDRRWILSDTTEENQPRFNQLNCPRGERRVYAGDLRTTTLKHPKAYGLGKLKEHYVEIEDEQGNTRTVLGNLVLEQQLLKVKHYIRKHRKNGETYNLNSLKRILGFLHQVQGIPLNELTLDCFIPSIQLKFSEQDFQDHPDFQKNRNGQFLDPDKVEQKLAMAEAVATRRAKQAAEVTWKTLEAYFDWREQELGAKGQPEGLANTSKRSLIGVTVLCCEAVYQNETNFQKSQRSQGKRRQTLGFEDIPVIVLLRSKYDSYPIDKQKIKKRINQTRCIPWVQAIRIFEKQRLLALNYWIDARDNHRKSGFVRRRRKPSGIAQEIQKAVILGLMLFIPTDRQQTYRNLQFGVNFKNGVFTDEDFEQFHDWGVPAHPNQAQFWINLEDFKTAETYGEFWYPVPNVQFLDGTTFYQLIFAWLWGFDDQEHHWPVCDEKNRHWQGYLDPEGNRLGWRAALEPEHDCMFTMPTAKTPFYERTFYSLVRNLFVRFTQEDGRPVPVSPHSIRHMLSNYLDKLAINQDEEKSFSYVLHHSPEIHQDRYVYRNNMARIAPAVKRMEHILNGLIL
jgi:hypothetical protein